MGKYDVNTIHKTKNNGDLEIIEYLDVNHRLVRFITTGYETTASVGSISTGRVRDPYVPSVFGVGFLGEVDDMRDHPLYKMLYKRWSNMIMRVHVVKTGKTITPEWLCFANFIGDALQLKGHELLYTHTKNNQIDLDCDILSNEKGVPSIYSRDTCQWVTHIENMQTRKVSNCLTRYLIGSVFQTNDGPVTLIDKDNRKWLIEFDDGNRKWAYIADVHRGQVRRPKAA